MEERRPKHLAWHETLELHELVAFQSFGLIKLKRFIGEVKDPKLHRIYVHTIKGIETNLKELLKFYSQAPRDEESERKTDDSFFAGDLLGFAKTSVRNYSIALTETATPVLRKTLTKQLQRAIETHEMVYDYMYEIGLYPSYDLTKLLQNDVNIASKALNMRY